MAKSNGRHIPDARQLKGVFNSLIKGLSAGTSLTGWGSFDTQEQEAAERANVTDIISLLATESESVSVKAGADVLLASLQDDLSKIEGTQDVVSLIGHAQNMDWLAMHLQQAYLRRLGVLCVLALVFLVCFELFAHFPLLHGNALVLLLGLVSFAAGLLQELRGRPRQLQVAFHTVRATAELLRILVFWRLNGIGDDISKFVAHRLEIRVGLVAMLVEQFKSPALIGLETARRLTLDHWVIQQLSYLQKEFTKHRILDEMFKNISTKLFIWGAGLMASLVAVRLVGVSPEDVWIEYLMTLAPSLIVVAAIAEFYSERRGYLTNAKRYEFAHHVYLRGLSSQSEKSAAKPVHKDHKESLLSSSILVGLPILVYFGAVAAKLVGSVAQPVITSILTGATVLAVGSLGFDLLSLKTAKTNSPPVRDEWLTGAESWPEGESFANRVKDVGIEAMHEVFDWYISNVDREITVPKG